MAVYREQILGGADRKPAGRIPWAFRHEPVSGTEPISIVPFRELSLPGSGPIVLAYGALDTKAIAYLSVQPFGQGVLSEAIRANQREHLKIIAHQDHHLVPISWLMIQVPRQQPFLRRVQNRIRKEATTAKRVRNPRSNPFSESKRC